MLSVTWSRTSWGFDLIPANIERAFISTFSITARPPGQPDLAPVGESTSGLLRLGRIVRHHVLGPVARQHRGELCVGRKVVAAEVKVPPVTMPRQGYIGGVPVHARRREHVDVLDRHTLQFMDGGGIAMIDMRIVLEVKPDLATVIETHIHPFTRYGLDRAQRAVLPPQPALVVQKHDPVTGRELPFAALCLHGDVVAKIPVVRNRSRSSPLSANTSALVWVRIIRVDPGYACRSRSKR